MATVRKQAGRALLVAWGMRAFWARQKVYVLTHLHRQITLLEARKTAPPPPRFHRLPSNCNRLPNTLMFGYLSSQSRISFSEHFFSKGHLFSIWLSTRFSRAYRGSPASGDAFSRGIEMACYVTPPVQCRWRCGERGLFDAKSVRLRISSKTECVARFPVAFPFHFAGCFFELGKRWSSSLPRCGNPPLSLRGSNLADFVPKGMRSAKGCACVEWATERSFGLSAVLACELASRQKLFWRRYRKGFVTPAFTPCL